ncbi:MAG: alkaline phosphatase [Oscillospiraceae bacterium]|jgi:alkaline phosphatase|nr:alkaline phosphatase [Oscillospiraceae bacterium]
MDILKTILAVLCLPLTLFGNLIGYRAAATAEIPKQYKNVIIMIGDGMGFNSIAWAKEIENHPGDWVMETMPVTAQSETAAWMIPITDSAAGATALACGIRNIDGEVSVYPLDPFELLGTPKTILELAQERGKAVGVVTTDSTSGATPAAFSSHAEARSCEEEISTEQMAQGFNLIWGAPSDTITQERAEAAGLEYITNKTQMNALSGNEKSFAQFSWDDLSNTTNTNITPTLKEMTVKAIDILDDDSDGFVIMIEAAHIDKFSHGNNQVGMAHHVAEFDKAIEAAWDYAKQDGETLVLVTADHETGWISENNGTYQYNSDQHSWNNVPVFVSDPAFLLENGKAYQNRQIGTQLGRAIGLGADVFPTPVLPSLW